MEVRFCPQVFCVPLGCHLLHLLETVHKTLMPMGCVSLYFPSSSSSWPSLDLRAIREVPSMGRPTDRWQRARERDRESAEEMATCTFFKEMEIEKRKRGDMEGDKRPLPEIDLTTGKEGGSGTEQKRSPLLLRLIACQVQNLTEVRFVVPLSQADKSLFPIYLLQMDSKLPRATKIYQMRERYRGCPMHRIPMTLADYGDNRI